MAGAACREPRGQGAPARAPLPARRRPPVTGRTGVWPRDRPRARATRPHHPGERRSRAMSSRDAINRSGAEQAAARRGSGADDRGPRRSGAPPDVRTCSGDARDMSRETYPRRVRPSRHVLFTMVFMTCSKEHIEGRQRAAAAAERRGSVPPVVLAPGGGAAPTDVERAGPSQRKWGRGRRGRSPGRPARRRSRQPARSPPGSRSEAARQAG